MEINGPQVPKARVSRPPPSGEGAKAVPLVRIVIARPDRVDSSRRRVITIRKGADGSSVLRLQVGEEVDNVTATTALRRSGGHFSLSKTIVGSEEGVQLFGDDTRVAVRDNHSNRESLTAGAAEVLALKA